MKKIKFTERVSYEFDHVVELSNEEYSQLKRHLYDNGLVDHVSREDIVQGMIDLGMYVSSNVLHNPRENEDMDIVDMDCPKSDFIVYYELDQDEPDIYDLNLRYSPYYVVKDGDKEIGYIQHKNGEEISEKYQELGFDVEYITHVLGEIRQTYQYQIDRSKLKHFSGNLSTIMLDRIVKEYQEMIDDINKEIQTYVNQLWKQYLPE